jgi:peptidoglycan/xylan/chitin deacetylase (PgdA/CDA1 family)
LNSNITTFLGIAGFTLIALILIVFGVPQPIKTISGQQEQHQLPPPQHQQYQRQYVSSNLNDGNNDGSNSSNNNSTKLVILTFGDTLKGQITTAKPILDKYRFKASFFITCDWVGLQRSKDPRMTWQDISLLQRDGQDIESKTMTHRDMSHLSAADLNFEVAQSKKCLSDHGINKNVTIFATPHGDEWKNATLIDEISKYYNLADNGFAPLMFLRCDGYKNQSSQTDCRTYFDNGTLTFVNRYSIREWSHNAVDRKYRYNDPAIFQRFVQEVNSQQVYNKNGVIDAIPIIAYHDIDYDKAIDSTDISLFDQEMKYLHDNGFKVLTMSDLGYNENSKILYVKGIF